MQELQSKNLFGQPRLYQTQFPENQSEDSGCCLQVHRAGFPLPYIPYRWFAVIKH